MIGENYKLCVLLWTNQSLSTFLIFIYFFLSLFCLCALFFSSISFLISFRKSLLLLFFWYSTCPSSGWGFCSLGSNAPSRRPPASFSYVHLKEHPIDHFSDPRARQRLLGVNCTWSGFKSGAQWIANSVLFFLLFSKESLFVSWTSFHNPDSNSHDFSCRVLTNRQYCIKNIFSWLQVACPCIWLSACVRVHWATIWQCPPPPPPPSKKKEKIGCPSIKEHHGLC